NDSTPMIVRIARVKVGNRQASYAVRPEPRFLNNESRGSGVWACEMRALKERVNTESTKENGRPKGRPFYIRHLKQLIRLNLLPSA
ncbi:hypothetical protein, partial [Paraburkholderia sp.]|uniref:hypothetical protein n=1 Tax=Paraburkholderia sp. TaxID=1926495 RepID=UPI00286EBEAF